MSKVSCDKCRVMSDYQQPDDVDFAVPGRTHRLCANKPQGQWQKYNEPRCDGRCDDADCWCGRRGPQSSSGLPATHDPGDELKLGKPTPTLRTRLEKVRDELKSATDLTETHQYGYFKAGNALRMLEEILEGK